MTNFILQIPIFFAACIFIFIIPGLIVLDKTKFKYSYWESLTFSTIIGFALFTLLSFVLLYLKIEFLILVIYLFINIVFLKMHFNNIKTLKFVKSFLSSFSSDKLSLITLVILIVGVIGQLAIISPSGITSSNGDLLFWSSHGHDASWHIALAEQLKLGSPWKNPTYSGENLYNYHFFSDISITVLNDLFHLSPIDLYFRFFPLIFSLLLGGSVYYLTKRLTNNSSSALWAIFFTYFCGSFGYIVTFFRDNRFFGGETLFGSSQVQSSSGNPPQISASIIFLTFFYFFLIYQNNKKAN